MNNGVLKKNLGVTTAISIVVGCVIGSGIFFKPQAIYSATHGAPGLGLLAWIITGIASVCGALTFAEIAIMFPRTGGIVTYLKEAFGETIGFLAGWIQVLVFYPAMISALAVAFSNQLSLFLKTDQYIIVIAIGCIIILAGMNSLGSKPAGRLQIIFTVSKLIPIVLLIIFGFIKGQNDAPLFSPMIGKDINTVVVLGQLMVSVLFAFEGWTGVGAIAGELKNPGKDLPRAIIGGVSIIMAIYLIINIAYLKVIPASSLAFLKAPAAAVAIKLFGNIGGKIIAVGIMISVFGACNGFLMSGSRVAFAMAQEETLPFSSYLSKLNKDKVPFYSIFLVALIGIIYSISGQFNLLTDLAVFSSWLFYTLTFIAVIKLRKDKSFVKREYKVPFYPIIPLIAVISGLFVVINQLFLSGIRSTVLSFASLGVLLLGYLYYKHFN
ncbi:amino acid permease [Eggerthia catenaformis]|uniref:APC family permease n=1 Tax=Eggerthia catenaformis TaxID=31973 RepID=UPI0028F0DFEB|nr:amino acid permease [Eggerthia catenaformis]